MQVEKTTPLPRGDTSKKLAAWGFVSRMDPKYVPERAVSIVLFIKESEDEYTLNSKTCGDLMMPPL